MLPSSAAESAAIDAPMPNELGNRHEPLPVGEV